MEDSFRLKGLRKKLIDKLREKGITDENVLAAIDAVPRHFFFSNIGLQQRAYEDQPFPIAAGQTISQPYTVAFQSQLLEIKKRDKILEIGTGSGYQAAILAQMGAKVYSVERQQELYRSAKDLLAKLRLGVDVFYGDGFKGLPQFAPFDKILLTAAPQELPMLLAEQLKPGGFIVAPVGGSSGQIMLKAVKTESGQLQVHEAGEFSFVPMLPGTQNQN
jgi:protein-L-isoaspartate(D-aspartate) O-methyltransferase